MDPMYYVTLLSAKGHEAMASQCDIEAALSYALRCVGKEELKLMAEQKEVIREVYEGNDVFVWLPTGFGKSLCFECLPFVFDMKPWLSYRY